MIDDPDVAIRRAAFKAVKAMSAHFRPGVPWAVIESGFEFEGRRLHLATRARGIFWPKDMLNGVLSVKTTIPRLGRQVRYADLVERNVEHFDYCFQGDDPDSRDNRRLRWCSENDAPLIYFYGIEEKLYVPLWPVYVEGMDRGALKARLVLGDPEAALIGAEGPRDWRAQQIQRRYRTVETKARLHQAAFSAMVLRAYNERCAICNLPRVRALVEAAHIIPDHDVQGRPEVPNGLALCSLHHSAYDADLIGISPQRIIEISPQLLDEHDGPVLEYGIKNFRHRPIHLPARESDQPGRQYLEWRWERFKRAC